MKRRIGRFTITQEFLRDLQNFKFLSGLFGQMVILEAQYDIRCQAVRFIAISPLFEEVEPHCVEPDYEAIISREEQDGQFPPINQKFRVHFKKFSDYSKHPDAIGQPPDEAPPFRERLRAVGVAVRALFPRKTLP